MVCFLIKLYRTLIIKILALSNDKDFPNFKLFSTIFHSKFPLKFPSTLPNGFFKKKSHLKKLHENIQSW
jgi:hypothetical protein